MDVVYCHSIQFHCSNFISFFFFLHSHQFFEFHKRRRTQRYDEMHICDVFARSTFKRIPTTTTAHKQYEESKKKTLWTTWTYIANTRFKLYLPSSLAFHVCILLLFHLLLLLLHCCIIICVDRARSSIKVVEPSYWMFRFRFQWNWNWTCTHALQYIHSTSMCIGLLYILYCRWSVFLCVPNDRLNCNISLWKYRIRMKEKHRKLPHVSYSVQWEYKRIHILFFFRFCCCFSRFI